MTWRIPQLPVILHIDLQSLCYRPFCKILPFEYLLFADPIDLENLIGIHFSRGVSVLYF